MKIYFLHNGTEQEGPFDIKDLKGKEVNADTPIWFEGQVEWTTVKEVPELKELMKVTPPPFKKENISNSPPPIPNKKIEKEEKSESKSSNTTQQKPIIKNKTGKIFIVIGIILLLIVGGGVILNQLNNNGSGYSSGYDSYEGASSSTYQEQKMSIEEKELMYPTDFLTADGTYRETLMGDKLKVKGKIYNSATVASYKDANVEVTYYSKSGTNLGSESYTIWDVFSPGTTTTFNLKIKNYSNVKSIGWEVTSAETY